MSPANNSPIVSAENAQYALWYLVEGDSSPFKITLSPNKDIADLMILIRANAINASDPVLAKELTLWKVGTL
jgi:hypothetical protein